MDINKKRQQLAETLSTKEPLSVDPFPDESGVLLSDKIEYYSKHHNLIDRFEADQLKPAGYELTVSDEYYLGGRKYSLSSTDIPEHIAIPPFEVVVIKTQEILCLPRFLIARWNLRVRWAYKGLLWIGAAQVDPGYVGHLFCPIYNLSDRTVILPEGERIALIDFVKTTPYSPGKSKKYEVRRAIIEDYECDQLESALITHATKKIDRAEEMVNALDAKVSWFTTIVVTLIGIIAAAFVVQYAEGVSVLRDKWTLFFITFLAMFAFVNSTIILWGAIFSPVARLFESAPWRHSYLSARIYARRHLLFGVFASFIVSFLVAGATYFFLPRYVSGDDPAISQLEGRIRHLEERLVSIEEAGEVER